MKIKDLKNEHPRIYELAMIEGKGWFPWMKNPPPPSKLTSEVEAIKPDYYKLNIKGVDCDLFDISEAMNLPVRLFSALKYFRTKGDKAKKINDLEKSIQCITLEIERLKCQ